MAKTDLLLVRPQLVLLLELMYLCLSEVNRQIADQNLSRTFSAVLLSISRLEDPLFGEEIKQKVKLKKIAF